LSFILVDLFAFRCILPPEFFVFAMKGTWYLSLFLIVLTICIPLSGANGAYITEVRVSNVNYDADKAKKTAIAGGQRKGFIAVLDEMGIDASNNVLISDEEVTKMVRAMKINDEKTTSNSYSALLLLEFNSHYVDHILHKHHISKLSPKFESYLVVPVLNKDNNFLLWGKDNRLLQPFLEVSKSVKNILVIRDNYDSRKLIKDSYFKKPTFSSFGDVMRLYNANNVALVLAKYSDDLLYLNVKIHILNDTTAKVATLKYQIKNPENIDLDFNEMAIMVTDYIDKIRRDNEKIVVKVDNGSILMFVAFPTIEDFNKISDILKNCPDILKIQLGHMSKKLAKFTVKYKSDIETLMLSLVNSGLKVNENDGVVYVSL